MAKREHIPQSADELTVEWFQEVVGAPADGTITGVSKEIIGEGIGFVGEIHRCSLEWESQPDGAPSSVIAKLPSGIDKNRSLGEALQAYEREIVVYSQLRDRLGTPMPEHVYSHLDPNPAKWLERVIVFLFEKLPVGGVGWLVDRLIGLSAKSKRRYLLVMEDIADARPPSQVEGGSVDDALAALPVLARFHATNWMSREIADAYPIIWPLDRTPKVQQAIYRSNREEFENQWGEILGPTRMARMDEIQENLPELLDRLASGPWTLIHGDYRLDNLMFRPDGDIVVLDWQLLSRGRAGWDVAYFITTALEPTHRSEEELMLRTYHDALVEAGITDYSYEMLVEDCELTKEVLVHRVGGAEDFLDTELKDQDEDLLRIMVERAVGWIDE